MVPSRGGSYQTPTHGPGRNVVDSPVTLVSRGDIGLPGCGDKNTLLELQLVYHLFVAVVHFVGSYLAHLFSSGIAFCSGCMIYLKL